MQASAVETGYQGSKDKGKLHGYGKHVFPRSGEGEDIGT